MFFIIFLFYYGHGVPKKKEMKKKYETKKIITISSETL